MIKWIERFESAVNWAVLLMMAVVVLMLAAGFAVDIGRNATTFLIGSMTTEQVFGIFGDLLLILGGNIRVGLEDNLYLRRGVFASNGELVSRARMVLEALGYEIASAAETRRILRLVSS